MPLIVKLYERIEVVAGDDEDAPPMTGRLPAVAKAQAAELAHFAYPSFVHNGTSYGLVPVLRPELAGIYGDSPLVGAADQIVGKGRSLLATVLVARLAMAPP